MKVWVLGSGSEGNAILVECDGSRILVDCGYGTRSLAGRLRTIGVEPESIDGCVITHEHSDHIRGAGSASRRWGWGIYATPGTACAPELAHATVHRFSAGMTIDFPRMTVETVTVPHDANDTVGFVVTSRSTGARAGLFYDFGRITPAIAQACESLDILVLESNHDDDMLRYGPYAPWLQRRIAGRFGHLSNRNAGLFVRSTPRRGLNHLVLAHLSKECNSADVALKSMRGALARTTFRGVVTAAPQDAVVGPFTPGAIRAEKPLQYSLF